MRRRVRFWSALLVAGLLASCAGERERRPREPERPRRAGIDSRETRQCLADLDRLGVAYQTLPDRNFGGGCSAFSSVKLLDIGVPVTNLGAMSCPLARSFAGWVRNGIAPAARIYLGGELARVDTMGSYACRNVNGAATGRLSEHAFANAVDVAGVVLKDGRRVSVKADWRSPSPQVKGFLNAVHSSACKRFRTVLSPDYNAYHADHLHLDMGSGPFCR